VTSAITSQVVAAIDMLDNLVLASPEKTWGDRTREPQYWFLVYHRLLWLDLYLFESVLGFIPPPHCGLEELDPAELLPPRLYSQRELRTYLGHCRRRCIARIEGLSVDQAERAHQFDWGMVRGLESLLYNVWRVQHHIAQLQLILGLRFGAAPLWVAQAKRRGAGPQGCLEAACC